MRWKCAARGEEAAELPLAEGQQPRTVKLIGSKLRFLTNDVAIEDGESEVGRTDSPGAVRGRFSAIWVKRDGRWRLAKLREACGAASLPPQLADLDWLIGKWSAAAADARLTVNGRWNSTKTFCCAIWKWSATARSYFAAASGLAGIR